MKRKKTPIKWPEPLKWRQTGDNEWTVPDNEAERYTRIKRATNRWLGLTYDDHYTYRRGRYVGTYKSVKEAKRRAERFPIGDV